MTDLENKWYKYVCSKYPFLTWRVEFDETINRLIFECRNLNFRCGRYKFLISYYYTDDFKEYVQSQSRDSFARKEITKYVKDIKELCKRDLKCKIKS